MKSTPAFCDLLSGLFRPPPKPHEEGRCELCNKRRELLQTTRGPVCKECNVQLVADRLLGSQPTIYVGLYTAQRPDDELVELSGAGYTRREVPVDIKAGEMRGLTMAIFEAQGPWPEIEGYFISNGPQSPPLVYQHLQTKTQLKDGQQARVDVRLTIG